jgi:hypothetical protein
MVNVTDPDLAQRFRVALDMFEFGEQMQSATLRRLHPEMSDEAIAVKLQAWRVSRPGAPSGDADGVSSRRFG